MFEKLTDAYWRFKMPKSYRERTEAEIRQEYEMMREEFLGMMERKERTTEELLDYLDDHQELISAIDVVDKRYFYKLMRRKK